MLTTIVIIVVVILLFLLLNAPSTTQQTTTTGRLRENFPNFYKSLSELFDKDVAIICDDNTKLVYRVFQTNSNKKITGEFLFKLCVVQGGHEVSVSLRGGPTAKLYKSESRFFNRHQSTSTYKKVIGELGTHLALQASNDLVKKLFS